MIKRNNLKKYLLILLGVILMFSLFGCGERMYSLNLPSGFESKKLHYKAGEEVKLNYSLIATDTDYSFYADVDFEQSYSDSEGYVFTFTMPNRDVYFWVESNNSMVYQPPVEYTEDELKEMIDEDNWIFDYYEGVVATVGGDGYDEYVLYTWEGDSLLLARYSKWEQTGNIEYVSVCEVPMSVYYDALKLAHEYGLKDWKDGVSITGGRYVVKYAEDGKVVKVSSDDMPENGFEAFDSIASSLDEAWKIFGPKADEGSIGIIDDPKPELVSE